MANIETTDRKYYDTERKVNTLAAYAGALLKPAQTHLENIKQQQQIKVASLGTSARLDMEMATNQWRLDNQSNPNDPEAQKNLQGMYDDILANYRDQIDPIARIDWDLQANKLKGAYDLQNQAWSLKQNQDNVKYDIQESMKNYNKLAQSYGAEGRPEEALADYAQSYNALLDYGARNLGTEDAARLISGYGNDFAISYLAGLSQNNPKEALKQLEESSQLKEMLDVDASELAKKLINNQIENRNFEIKVKEFNTELQLDEELSNMNNFDALRKLEENENNVSSKWYKARHKALLNNAGINAETRAEKASDLLLDIASIDAENAKDFFKKSNAVLDDIETAYGSGELSLTDKRILTNQLKKRQGKNIPVLIDENSGWLMPYDFSDAKKDFDDSLVSPNASNTAMLEYVRTLNDNDYDSKQRRELAKSIIRKYNNRDLSLKSFSSEAEAEKAFSKGIIKKGDSIYINGVRGTVNG